MFRTLRNWLRPWTDVSAKQPLRRLGPTMRRRPGIEPLEDRHAPALFVVNNAADPVGAHAGTTLRDAINAANSNGQPSNSITFAAGITTITLLGRAPVADSEFLIQNNLTIDGAISGGRVTIETNANLRIFGLTTFNFTLQNTNLRSGSPLGAAAGGLVFVASGTASLTNVNLSDSTALTGGGLAQTGGTTNLNSVRFDNNLATNGGGMAQTGGTANFTNLVFNNNTATVDGGGLHVSGGALFEGATAFTNNTATISGGGWFLTGVSRFIFLDAGSFGNNAQFGGLLAVNNGNYIINPGSVLAGNSATEGGAFYVGLNAAATMTINGSTVRNNTASVRGGGGVVNGGSTLIVNDSVFGGLTSASANSSPFGAAITSAGNLTLSRATVANNAGNASGGGIRLDAGAITINNSTISSNTGAAGLFIAGGNVNSFVNNTVAFNGGNGVSKVAAGAFSTGNSIFANNAGLDFVGGINSLGNNLFGNASGATGTVASDQLNVAPLLGALGANGATAFPSLTHALQPGSPAFNAGNNTLANNANLTTDQRGSNRFVGAVDIGAYELLDTVALTAALTAPGNINAASAGGNTTTVVVTYNDVAGGGLEGASGVDDATFGVNDITVSNGAIVQSFSAAGNVVTYTIRSAGASWGASPQGAYTISLTAGGVRDRAGNNIAGVANFGTFFVDTSPPTATLTTPPATINAANGGNATNNFTVTFADTGSGVDVATIGAGDFTVSNGATTATVTLFARMGNIATYSINAPGGTWANSPQGAYTIALVGGSVADLAGNPIAAVANFGSFLVQTSRPFATVTTQPANITVANATPGTNSFTVTYTSLNGTMNPASFGADDVTITNPGPPAANLTVISVMAQGNAVTYILQAPGGMWSNLPQGQYTIALNGNSVFDNAGNAVLANPTLAFFTVDVFRPTPTLTAPPATINLAYIGPQSNSFTINYSDIGLGVDTTTFNVGNVTVSNGATQLTVLTAMVSGTSVTYTVLPMGGSWATTPMGTYTIGIVGNSVRDLAGNGITANPNFAFFMVDLSRPTAALTTPPGDINLANSGPGTNSFTITYSDIGSGMNPATFVPGNVTVTNGTTTLNVIAVSASGNAVVTYTVQPPGGAWTTANEGTYTVRLNDNSVFDFAGNAVTGIPALATFRVDVTRPTVVVSPTGTLTNASPIVFTLNFSEPVTGLTTAGITVTNGTAGTLTQVTPSQYTLPVTPTADGFVTVTVNAGAAQDALGNTNLASNTASVESDRTGPVATFSLPSAIFTMTGPVTYTITWADPHFSAVTLNPGQVILNTTGTANGTVTSVTGAGNTRVMTIDNVFGMGTIAISLPPGVAVDTLGNLSAAAGPSTAFMVGGNRILNISQPPAPAFLLPGTTYIYAIDFSNTGNQISPNARILVNVPPPGAFIAASSTPGWVNVGGSQFQFSLGNLGIGASGRVNFAVNYPANTPPGTVAAFTAFITDTLADGAPVASSTVVSTIVNPNRLRWGRCC
jgi:hypothetical protein